MDRRLNVSKPETVIEMTMVSILNHFGLISEFVKCSDVHFLVSRYIKNWEDVGRKWTIQINMPYRSPIVNIVIDVDKFVLR